jgi:hypothetical protein
VNLASGINESIPVYLLQEASDKIWIEIRVSEGYLDVFELKGEVVGGAAFGMTSEEVVSDEANHESFRSSITKTRPEMRPPSPSIAEKQFVVEALKQGLRLDGRAALEMRQPTLTFGPDLGWVDCSLGKTRQEFISVSVIADLSLTIHVEECLARWRRKW